VEHVESQWPGSKPFAIAWPTIVVGQWNANDDVDIFDFDCEAKTNVAIEMISHRVGEWSDGVIVVFRIENPGQPNEQSHRIAENDDGPALGNGELRFANKDPMLTFQTTEKGTYRIHVYSQQRLDSSRTVPKYALEIRKPNPGFVLGVHISHPTLNGDQTRATAPTLSAGGAVMMAVHALRFDNFADPIELNIAGLPDGVRGGSGVIAKDQNLATLNLWNFGPPASPHDGTKVNRLNIIGSVEIGPQSITSYATPLEVTWSAIETFRSPTAKVLQSLNLAKLDAVVCPLTIELGAKDLDAKHPIRLDAIRGQSVKVPVRLTRRAGGEGAVTIRLHHGPPKVTVAEIKMEPKALDGEIEIKVPKDAPIGEFMLGALAESSISIPNPDPSSKEKTKSITLQLPTSNLRVRIGDSP
jgi:hypothetical protein